MGSAQALPRTTESPCDGLAEPRWASRHGPLSVAPPALNPPMPRHQARRVLSICQFVLANTKGGGTLNRRLWRAMAVIVGYFVLGMIAFLPELPDISQRIFSRDADLTLTVWYLGWLPHALVNGLNPFFSNAMFVPAGVNLAQNTEAPLLGLLMAPVTLAFGPLVSTNLLLVVSMPISAAAAFVVLTKWNVWGPAAALGGLAYGFSPYMVGQAYAHPVLLFVPLPPFIVMTVVSLLQGQGSSRRLGLQLGLLVSAQYLISPEVLVTVAILIFIALVCVALRHPSKVPERARTALASIGIALVVTAILLAYPVWMLIAGPQHFSGSTYPLENHFHYDGLSFFIHGLMQRLTLGLPSGGVGYLNPAESGGYIGIPVLIMIGLLAWRSRHSPRMQLSIALLICSAVLSLGAHLSFGGKMTHIPLPFLLLGHIPLIDNVLPSRISFETGACVAAVIAFGVDDLRRMSTWDIRRPMPRTQRRTAIVVTGFVLIVLVVTQVPMWPYLTQQAVALPITIRGAIPKGDPVAITYPYAIGSYITQPLLWQAEDGYRFRITGGYSFHPTRSGRPARAPDPLNPPGTQLFLDSEAGVSKMKASPINRKLLAITRATLIRYHVRLVIVDRSQAGSGPVMKLFNEVLGPPNLSADNFSIWVRHGELKR